MVCQRRVRLLYAAALTLLCIATVGVWLFSPIYPDEIAFRNSLGRYIQDEGVVNGLYALCNTNAKVTPPVFAGPAWMLSLVDLTLSPMAIRALPFLTVSATVIAVIFYAVQGVNPAAAIVATTGLIGVSGSGLILARHEYISLLNVFLCLIVFFNWHLVSRKPVLRYGLLVLLLLSCVLSMYVHVQGILFLPLSVFFVYHILVHDLGKPIAVTFSGVFFLVVSQTAINFHHLSCIAYPGIEQLWSAMTLGRGDIELLIRPEWWINKFNLYVNSFLYLDSYTINYLPGLVVTDGMMNWLLGKLNRCIGFILIINLILAISFVLVEGVNLIFKCSNGVPKKSLRFHSERTLFLMPMAGLIIFPVLFLIVYDSVQNFYRSFFLNFLVAIVLAIVLSGYFSLRYRNLLRLWFGLSGILVIASLVTNAWWFIPRIVEPALYKAPSFSAFENFDDIKRQVHWLSDFCDMDLSKGRIIVDDFTYDALKAYSTIYPVTYLDLQSFYGKIEISDLISRVRPNFVLARCDSFGVLKITSQHRLGGLCCYSFSGD